MLKPGKSAMSTPTQPTEPEKQRLLERYKILQSEWRVRAEKSKFLRNALAIEAAPAIQFQLQQQVQTEEKTINDLEDQLSQIEHDLNPDSDEAGAFALLMMKARIDQLLADDEQLQQFLSWVQQKSCSVTASYKPAAIRAFYFSRASANILVNANAPNVIFNSVSDIDQNLIRDLTRTLDSDLARFLADYLTKTTVSDPTHILVDALIHDLAVARFHAFIFIRDLVLAQELALVRDLATSLKHDFAFAYTSNLEQPLQQLRKQLPNPNEDWVHFSQWWQTNGSAWAGQLRAVMIEHRNIGHDWQFSTSQKEQLQQYYEANKLLIDCLNSESYVSREVRQEIEDSLLLPIAEIERRFPRQRRQR